MPDNTVLVVDDDGLIGWALAKDLSSLGYATQTAGTVRDALARIRGSRFGFLFLDVHLPDGNGLELMPEVGRLSPETKIVVMSASDGGRTRQRALSSGALQYLEKPFDVSEARGILRSAAHPGGAREHARYLCRIALRITVVDPPEGESGLGLCSLRGVMADSGKGGIRLRTSYPLRVGQRVRTRPLSGRGPCLKFAPAELLAEVVWVRREHDGVVAGLRFPS